MSITMVLAFQISLCQQLLQALKNGIILRKLDLLHSKVEHLPHNMADFSQNKVEFIPSNRAEFLPHRKVETPHNKETPHMRWCLLKVILKVSAFWLLIFLYS